MIIVNSPHNPTGRVFNKKELELISELAIAHDVIVLSDEVYDKLILTGVHVPIASLPEMRERTITLRSLGKVFSVTGWKIGWSIAPKELTQGIRSAHQFTTFCAATPLQVAAATALRVPESYYDEYTKEYRERRDLLVDGLKSVGFKVNPSQGTYFVLANHSPFGFEDDISFAHHLAETCSVVGIPPSSFYKKSDEGKAYIRFAFCKGLGTLKTAVERLQALC
jgi:aspartate/methionine/tyrosine aminotransferase